MSDEQLDIQSIDPERVHRTAKLLWFALIMSQVIFAVSAVVVVVNSGVTQNASLGQLLLLVTFGAAVITFPAGLFVHRLGMKQRKPDGSVDPQAFMMAHILLWAMCESVTVISLLSYLFSGTFIPHVLPAAVSLVIQVRYWPDRAALQPADTKQ